MSVDVPVWNTLVPVLVGQDFSDLRHLNGSQGLCLIFFLELFVYFLQRSLDLRDIGHPRVFLFLPYFEVFKDIFFNVLNLIIDERQDGGKKLLFSANVQQLIRFFPSPFGFQDLTYYLFIFLELNCPCVFLVYPF